MPRSQMLSRFRPSTVIPAVLVGALAVTSVNGLATTQHTSLDHKIETVAKDKATDGFSYDLTTGVHSDFAKRYSAILADIRGRLRASHLYGSMTLTRDATDYFPVTLAFGRNSITLVFNTRDLYVVGWRNDGTNEYYRLGEGPATYGIAHTTQLPRWLNYNGIESAAGIGRGDLGISMSAIQGSINDLGNLNVTSAGRDQARALLILVQAFSEGARFDLISSHIHDAITHGTSYHTGTSSRVSTDGNSNHAMSVTGLDLENNWDGLSREAQEATDNHRAVNYAIAGGAFFTLAAIDAVLAVAKWHNTKH
ncbi:ribosome-inactivating family protein [Streptomyces europaeiscabiei]|uniref:ribosome-inactivating family protein n=1 Tax=Streptomyces europaeiscabiei TaxID=146819 RepID=UPI0029B79934|nr:ribosome-inactivating family protein [Streptomyces europaeiscabiei]MDX3581875.1 ribosome-inactivating family protein [Streptomyces europaeiscabiei]MDX3632578.1 ribosome-inactivating family protein [Streptomyces europaeiscabiei]MDX3646860.1 ribosome-inactivating family protein [Streptomyces europaeiscabiei]WUD36455.1 ribosome-inactivating family protein [Streptomyces europaeiscabiei]